MKLQFLIHVYEKLPQSYVFSHVDSPQAESAEYSGEILLKIDFAENFVCEARDKFQTAHWNKKQLSLFT